MLFHQILFFIIHYNSNYLCFSTHPLWTIIKPDVFREKFNDGTLDTFDVIFSYSSLEHSGLGIQMHDVVRKGTIIDYTNELRELGNLFRVLYKAKKVG